MARVSYMLVITNRNIVDNELNKDVVNHEAFGEFQNFKGTNEIRLAKAVKHDQTWKVELVKEPSKITKSNMPSKKVFLSLRDELIINKKIVYFLLTVLTNHLRIA
ncbi:hypothetical protein [Microbulbifer epialgicus]|uniref:Uncharacterized protein n=1 Tax=Microbulbifer epialgicus TaxID=393907 RepID=A0ABV4P530_9GAMM